MDRIEIEAGGEWIVVTHLNSGDYETVRASKQLADEEADRRRRKAAFSRYITEVFHISERGAAA